LITIREILDEQVKYGMQNGEFGRELTASSAFVAVILTQDWCPQWSAVQQWLRDLHNGGEPHDLDIGVYQLVYNRKEYFDRFLRFKEDVLGNSLIPYIRYYADGRLIGETNYVSAEEFINRFRRAGSAGG
jgi:hypothetical protein